MNEEYSHVLAAQLHTWLVMQIAHDKLGKSLFELSPDHDKQCQDRAYGMLKYCYALMGFREFAGLKVSDELPSKISLVVRFHLRNLRHGAAS